MKADLVTCAQPWSDSTWTKRVYTTGASGSHTCNEPQVSTISGTGLACVSETYSSLYYTVQCGPIPRNCPAKPVTPYGTTTCVNQPHNTDCTITCAFGPASPKTKCFDGSWQTPTAPCNAPPAGTAQIREFLDNACTTPNGAGTGGPTYAQSGVCDVQGPFGNLVTCSENYDSATWRKSIFTDFSTPGSCSKPEFKFSTGTGPTQCAQESGGGLYYQVSCGPPKMNCTNYPTVANGQVINCTIALPALYNSQETCPVTCDNGPAGLTVKCNNGVWATTGNCIAPTPPPGSSGSGTGTKSGSGTGSTGSSSGGLSAAGKLQVSVTICILAALLLSIFTFLVSA
jgi:hypothetical protein